MMVQYCCGSGSTNKLFCKCFLLLQEANELILNVVVVVVNFIKHQNRAITGERVAARAAPSYQYAMVLVIIT